MSHKCRILLFSTLLLFFSLSLLSCDDDVTNGPEVGYQAGDVQKITLTFPALEAVVEPNPAYAPIVQENVVGLTVRNVTIYKTAAFDPASDPVLYLLHGFGGTDSTIVERYEVDKVTDYLIAQGKIGDMMIVMPDGSNKFGGSFYTNSNAYDPHDHLVSLGNFEDYILKVDEAGNIDENCLIAQVENEIIGATVSADRRMIAGLSMGGYGAMKIALDYPDHFSSVSSHSGPLYFEDMKNLVPDMLQQNPRGILWTGRVLNAGSGANIVNQDTILTSLSIGHPNSPSDWEASWDPGVWLLKLDENLQKEGYSLEQFQHPESEDLGFSTIPDWAWRVSDNEVTDDGSAAITFNYRQKIFYTLTEGSVDQLEYAGILDSLNIPSMLELMIDQEYTPREDFISAFESVTGTDYSISNENYIAEVAIKRYVSPVINFAYFVTRNHYTDSYRVYFNDVQIDSVGFGAGNFTDGVVTPEANNIGIHYVVIDTSGAYVYYSFKDKEGNLVSNTVGEPIKIEGIQINGGVNEAQNTITIEAACRLGQSTPLEPTAKILSSFVFAMAAAFQPEATLPGVPQYEFVPGTGLGISLPYNTRGEMYETAWTERWLAHDPYTKLAQMSNADLEKLPHIYLDVGLSDEYRLNTHANWFHAKLDELGIAHEYESFSGGHADRFYERIKPMLEFHNSTTPDS